jgi:hypothetical protein
MPSIADPSSVRIVMTVRLAELLATVDEGRLQCAATTIGEPTVSTTHSIRSRTGWIARLDPMSGAAPS